LPGQGSLLTLNFAERYTHTAVSDLQKNWSSTFLLERDQEDAQSMNSIDVQKEGVWCIFCTPLRNAQPALRWPNKLGTELNERNAEMANTSHASLSNCKNCEAQKKRQVFGIKRRLVDLCVAHVFCFRLTDIKVSRWTNEAT